jgi:RimJ/RimL family protein N-acetyltransferase
MADPQVSTKRLTTRRWELSDLGWYRDAIDDDIRRLTRESPTMGSDAALLEHLDGHASSLSIAVLDASGLVGNLGIHRRDQLIEFSYWIAASARGKGYATELLIAATRWATEEFGPETTLELQIHPENHASMTVAERAGYRMSGYRWTGDRCADADGRVAIYMIER